MDIEQTLREEDELEFVPFKIIKIFGKSVFSLSKILELNMMLHHESQFIFSKVNQIKAKIKIFKNFQNEIIYK